MTSGSADALLQVSSGNVRALRAVYDDHAAAAWGLALLVTRSRRRAARVLESLFTEVAQSPERFADGRDLRVAILAAALRFATAEARRGRRWWSRPGRRSRAVRGGDLPARLDAAGDEEALRLALDWVEGLSPEQLTAPSRPPVPSAPRTARWASPPASLRPLLLMKSSEAARPERRYVRWFLLWLAPLAGLVLIRLSERAAPRVPVDKYLLTPVRASFDGRTIDEQHRRGEFLGEEPPK